MLRGHRCARQWPDGRLLGDGEKTGFSETGTELPENPTLGALHAQAIWRYPRTPPVDIGV
jgi:hypothetical protein